MRHFTLTPLFLLLTLLATSALAAWGAPLPGQSGLPPDLTIADRPDLATQLRTLYDMATWLREHAPKTGFAEKAKGWLGMGEQPAQFVDLSLLSLNAAKLSGRVIAVEGMFTPGRNATTASLQSEATVCVLSLPARFESEGLPQDLGGLPVRAEGTVEMLPNGMVSLRVQKLQPAPALTYLRLGRLYEIQKDYKSAVWAYRTGAAAAQAEKFYLGAFGATQSGFLALQQLREPKQAQSIFQGAWTIYTEQQPASVVVNTWVQGAEGDWQRLPLSQAIAPTLKRLNQDGFWYKLVDFFVVVMGGNAALGFLLLAAVSRLLLYPLTKKQLSSARDMQRLQPLMKKLQEKHKGDKQKFQEEFWKLCQEHGVNPLGGCLPMLVQMPVLFFVYAGIRVYIVNLDTQGFLWVASLAKPDMALLILYTISQIIFGKLTQSQNPQAAIDPQQRQQQQMMTWMMPIMFFVFFQNFPAGFMLYWLGTNIAFILQQYWFNYTAGPLVTTEGEIPPARPAAGGGWMSRLLTSKPKQDHPSEPQSFDAKQAQAAGKMTSREEAEKRRKSRRRRRPPS